MVLASLAIKKIYINKTYWSKTLHLLVEINNYVVEGLVDIGASMSIMVVVVVRKLGIMHLVTKFETYKIASRIVTQTMGRIDEVLVKVGGVQCTMTFMVVNNDNYDILLGLDFLIKTDEIVDLEQGLIQVKHGLGANVEVLPLTMMNMLYSMSSKTKMRDVNVALENTQITDDFDMTIRISYQYNSIIPKGMDALVSNLDIDMDNNEHYDEGSHQVE
jgi:hypothetical protein